MTQNENIVQEQCHCGEAYAKYGDDLCRCAMTIKFHFNRGSFDTLKELLRRESSNAGDSRYDSVALRMKRDALKRVFDQIRDVEYNDK